MIARYAQNGRSIEAVKLFERVMSEKKKVLKL